jgi:uncharacterized protein (TIGR02246 family)
MSTRSRIAFLAVFTLLASSAAFASDKTAIESRITKWQESLAAGDAAGVAAIYAKDGQLLPPDGVEVNGRAAIQEYWDGAVKAGFKNIKLELLELHGTGNVLSEVGHWTFQDADGKALDHGKYIVLWKKSADGWQIYRDIWNDSVPPEPAADAAKK